MDPRLDIAQKPRPLPNAAEHQDEVLHSVVQENIAQVDEISDFCSRSVSSRSSKTSAGVELGTSPNCRTEELEGEFEAFINAGWKVYAIAEGRKSCMIGTARHKFHPPDCEAAKNVVAAEDVQIVIFGFRACLGRSNEKIEISPSI
jgi:hypothetical protein